MRFILRTLCCVLLSVLASTASAQAASSNYASCWLRLPANAQTSLGGIVDVGTLRSVDAYSTLGSSVQLRMQFREGTTASLDVSTSREAAEAFIKRVEALLAAGCARRP